MKTRFNRKTFTKKNKSLRKMLMEIEPTISDIISLQFSIIDESLIHHK